MGNTHSVWDTVKSNTMYVMRAIVKVRILTGTYLLQIHRKKFKMDGVIDVSCPLCCLEDEDIVYMLTRCPALSETRTTYMGELNSKSVFKPHLCHVYGQIVSVTPKR